MITKKRLIVTCFLRKSEKTTCENDKFYQFYWIYCKKEIFKKKEKLKNRNARARI